MSNAPHPGKYIKSELDRLKMTQAELSVRTGITRANLNGIIKGNRAIGSKSAVRLSFVVDSTYSDLLKLQLAYDLAALPKLKRENAFLQRFPIKEWKAKGHLKNGTADEVLKIFQVAGVEQFDKFYGLAKNKTLCRVIIESLNR